MHTLKKAISPGTIERTTDWESRGHAGRGDTRLSGLARECDFMAGTLSAAEEETQRLIDECDAAGQCIPCLELLRRIDADLAQMDREEAFRRRRRSIAVALIALMVVMAGTAGFYFYF